MMAPSPSPEPPRDGLRPDYTSRQVLTDSAPASRETTARRIVRMRRAPASRDLAYTTALVAACQRMWAARDVALLLRTIVDEAVGLIAADGAAVVAYTKRSWQILATGPNDAVHDDAGQDDAGHDDSATAAAIEMLSRQDLLRHAISIDDLGEGPSGDGLGWRALLVVGIEGSPRQPLRLLWYATRPATLSPYVEVAEAFAHLASLALGAVTERDNLNRAVLARHRVGVAQGLLMTRRQLTADQAFTLLQRQSQNSHVKLRTIAQTVIQTGDLPANGESKTT
jgi:ANTAR domain